MGEGSEGRVREEAEEALTEYISFGAYLSTNCWNPPSHNYFPKTLPQHKELRVPQSTDRKFPLIVCIPGPGIPKEVN